jgi:hypothetical protein
MSVASFDSVAAADGTNPIDQAVMFHGILHARWQNAQGGSLNSGYDGISSLDDDGTGNRGINLSITMVGSSYEILLSCDDDAANTAGIMIDVTAGTQTTGAFDFEQMHCDSVNTRTNRDVLGMGAVGGDLA